MISQKGTLREIQEPHTIIRPVAVPPPELTPDTGPRFTIIRNEIETLVNRILRITNIIYIRYSPSERARFIARSIDDPDHKFNAEMKQIYYREMQIREKRANLSQRLGDFQRELKISTDPSRIQQIEIEIADIKRNLENITQVYEKIWFNRFVQAVSSLFGKKEPLNLRRIDHEITLPSDSKLTTEEQTEIKARIDLKLQLVERILRQIVPMSNYGISDKLTIFVSTEADVKRIGRASRPARIQIGPNSSLKTLLHEILHVIEFQNPVLAERVKAYYNTRTKNSRIERINDVVPQKTGYSDSEFIKPDDFAHLYMGKVYSSGTELVSMFSEFLTLPESIRINKKTTSLYRRRDPDYVRFILDVLMDPRSYEWSETWQYES